MGAMRSCVLAVVGAALVEGAASQAVEERQALQLERTGRLAEAESAWKVLSAAHPRDAMPPAHIGLLEAQQQRYAAAVTYYRRAIGLDPHLPEVVLDLGLAYFKLGENAKAIEVLAPLLAADPDDLRLNVVVGMAHYGKGDYKGAVPYLNHAAVQNPRNLQLLLDLGHSCLLSKQLKCVAEVYERMAAIDENSAEVRMLKGELLDELRDTVGAIEEFQAAERADPSQPNVHFGLGYLLWTQKRYAEAADQFEVELSHDSGHSNAALYLGDTDVQLGSLEDARKILEPLARTNPGLALAHLDLGIIYFETGSTQEARRQFNAAISLDPKNVSAHWRLGRLYKTMGRKTEAYAEFEKARHLNQEEIDAVALVMAHGRDSSRGETSEGKETK